MDKIKDRQFTSFAIIAIDGDGGMISTYESSDQIFAMIGALEAIKKELLEMVE